MSNAHKQSVASLNAMMRDFSIEEALLMLSCYFPGAVSLSTSFSNEDQLITHLIATYGLDISVFTLDTGRHFPETYATWHRTIMHYRIVIRAYYPDTVALEEYITGNGPDGFYRSLESRRSCCYLRKVAPLKKALKGVAVWITGLRSGHSHYRSNLDLFEWDESNKVIKFNPLVNWTVQEVDDYISENSIPSNPLYMEGFQSIGCAPCTRAVAPGEDLRAGRWWWETSGRKECGLHEIVKL